ncbi:WD40-repeat-containing domain protein, partial [Dimargaris cristalligena]
VVDAQGLQFTHSLTSISRERYQQLRQRHYDNYRNTDHSLAEVQNQLTPVKTGGQFYRFRYSSLRPTEQSYIAHFQLRNLVRATGADEIFYVHQSGLRRWSPSSRKSHAVVDIRDEQSVLTTSTLATNSEMAFLGGLRGDYIIRNLSSGDSQRGILSTQPNGILNYAEIAHSYSGAPYIYVASNDCHIRTLNVGQSRVVADYDFEYSVNCATISPDGKSLAVVGDSCDTLLLDPLTGRERGKLSGHVDFSFSCAWSPDGRYLATGNQDRTCRIYDIRYPRAALHVLGGKMASIRTLRFSPDGHYLALGESTDYVHVVDVHSDFQHTQVVDFFGDVAG